MSGHSSVWVALGTLSFAAHLALQLAVEAPGGGVSHPSILSFTAHPGPLADFMSVEQGPAFADLMWLQVVQEVGAHQRTEIDYRTLETWMQAATDFDPRYENVYYTGGVFLSSLAYDAEASNRLLEKGLEHLPRTWQLWMLLGFNKYFIQGDGVGASRAWAEAGKLEGSPPWLTALAARSLYQAGETQAAMEGLQSLVDLLPEGRRKEMAAQRLEAMRNEQFLVRLDAACDRFRRRAGRMPQGPGELRQAGLWDGPDRDLLGGELSFELAPVDTSTRCVTRSTEVLLREFEAADRLGSQVDPRTLPPVPSEE